MTTFQTLPHLPGTLSGLRARACLVTFTRPVVGPKVYTSRGPSGFVETFTRTAADESLQKLLGKLPLKTLVDGYLRKSALEGQDSWSLLTTYLSELIGLDDELLPLDAVIAFWAHVGFARDTKKKAEGN
jgi:hypothetical protein